MADETQHLAVPAASAARSDRVDGLSFAVTTVLALAVYLFTLAPDVTLGFSGILSTGAMYAGVPHPPGYPVWTIYSWCFTKLLPFANIAWRVAVGSAVAAAAACGVVAFMVSFGGRMALGGRPSFASLKPSEQSLLRGVCGCVAGLVLGFSGAVWSEAVIADIWALSLLLFTLVLALAMRWMFEPERRRFLSGVFVLFGLLLTSSQEMLVALPGLVGAVMLADPKLGRDTALFVLPLAAVATAAHQWSVWITFPAKLNWPMLAAFAVVWLIGVVLAVSTRCVGTEWRAALLCGALLLLGLAFYFYVPLASMTNPPVNWAYPRTPEGFLHAVSRGQYEKARPTADLGVFLQQLGMCLRVAGKQLGWPSLLVGLLPLGFLLRLHGRGRRWVLALLAVFLGVGPLLVALVNPRADLGSMDLLQPYFASSYVILAVWLGLGLVLVGSVVARLRPAARP